MMRPPRGVWRLHQPNRALRAEKGAGQIGVDDHLPLLVGQILHRNAGSVHAGVVEQEIEPAELLLDGGEQRGDRIGIADVAAMGEASAAHRLDLARRGVERVQASARERHVPARARERQCGRFTDPRPPPVISANLSVLMFPPLLTGIPLIAARPRARQSGKVAADSGASRQTAAATTKPPPISVVKSGVSPKASSTQSGPITTSSIEISAASADGTCLAPSMNKAKANAIVVTPKTNSTAEVEGADGRVGRDRIAESRRDERRQRVDRGDRQRGIAPLQDDQHRERHGHREGRATGRAGGRVPSPPATMTTIPTIARLAAISVRREARSPVSANAMPAAKNGSVA